MKKTFFIINLIILAMTISNSNASSKVRVEDLDLDYFKETVKGQLWESYTWAGVLEGEMDKDGYVPPKKPKAELREAFAALGRREVETFHNSVMSYYGRMKAKDKYRDLLGMTALFLNTLDKYAGGFGNFRCVIENRTAHTSGTSVVSKCAVRKKDGNRVDDISELEDFDAVESTLTHITFETAKEFVEMLGGDPVDGARKSLSKLKL
jgi:hypothetical protein